MKLQSATVNIANELFVFGFAVKRMKEAMPSLKSDKDLYEAMGVVQSTYSSWKKRDNIAMSGLIDFCIRNDIDMNWFFKGEPKITSNEVLPSKETQTSFSDKQKEMLLKSAITQIIPEMERANLEFSDEIYNVMIKTYLNFKDRPGVDIKTVLRAVAEANVKE